MSGQPGGADEFTRRLQELISKLRGPVPDGGAAESVTDAVENAPAQSRDAFSENLARALRRARGEDEPGPEPAEDGAQPADQAVGEGEYVVHEADCVSSIAKRYGFFWETLWNHADNSALREARQNPNVLFPGDRIHIPEKRRRDEPIAAEQRHRFKRKGEPSKLRLRLMQGPAMLEPGEERDPNFDAADRPMGNVPYTLEVENQTIEGTADADGWVICSIPGDAQRGRLTVNPGLPEEFEMNLFLGKVAPVSTTTGVRQRLRNLGFDVEASDSSVLTSRLKQAIRAFQAQHELEVTGKPDEATRQTLLQVHGC